MGTLTINASRLVHTSVIIPSSGTTLSPHSHQPRELLTAERVSCCSKDSLSCCTRGGAGSTMYHDASRQALVSGATDFAGLRLPGGQCSIDSRVSSHRGVPCDMRASDYRHAFASTPLRSIDRLRRSRRSLSHRGGFAGSTDTFTSRSTYRSLVLESKLLLGRKGREVAVYVGARSLMGPSKGRGSEILSLGGATRCAIGNAFSSMVLIMKTLQSYALQMRSTLYLEDIRNVVGAVHKEMQLSFLWLFQQVFSSTPSLMVAVMLLFSDFTVHSTTESLCLVNELEDSSAIPAICMEVGARFLDNVAFSPSPPLSAYSPHPAAPVEALPYPLPSYGGGFGGNGNAQLYVGHADDGDWMGREIDGSQAVPRGMGALQYRALHGQERVPGVMQPGDVVTREFADRSLFKELLEEIAKAMDVTKGTGTAHVQLDQETIRQLVAPGQQELRVDDTVFDRTDLEYQMAIGAEPCNPMLLSNYAQFLYVVRRDNDRAEVFFRRAMEADPLDGDILGHFASFLWLGRGNRTAAEGAYKAAIASDPSNPYYSGSYAHFLWHCGDDDIACIVPLADDKAGMA